ncbi:MAG: hypothetical protein QM296_12770 [Bacillota bacterium]|nr:hypothetical protein [Bacillota bacterium]
MDFYGTAQEAKSKRVIHRALYEHQVEADTISELPAVMRNFVITSAVNTVFWGDVRFSDT